MLLPRATIGRGIISTALFMLYCSQSTQAQQYQYGVGRDVDPGRLHGVSTLRAIGGFQRVGVNSALDAAKRNKDAPVLPFGGSGKNQRMARGLSNDFSRSASIDGKGAFQSRISSPIEGARDLFRQTASVRSALGGSEQLRGMRGPGFQQYGDTRSMRSGGGMESLARNYRSSSNSQYLYGMSGYAGKINTLMGSNRSASQNIAVGSAESQEAPEGPKNTTLPSVSLDSVIKERLDGQMKSYLSRGESELRSGKYHEAYNTYKLAGIIESGNRPAKQGIIYASIATERYTVARNTLFWLLEHDPDVVTQTIDIDTVFGNRTIAQRHLGALNSFVTVNSAPDYICLQAFILWNAGDKTRALSLARGAAAETEPNSVHHILVSRMEAGMQTSAPLNPPSSTPQAEATNSIQ